MDEENERWFLDDDDMEKLLDDCMERIIHYDDLIENKAYLPENVTMDYSSIQQNSTLTIYVTYIDTLTGKNTYSDPEGVCHTTQGLIETTYKHSHRVNRGAYFDIHKVLSANPCAHIDKSKFPACQLNQTDPDGTFSIFPGGTTVGAGFCTEINGILGMSVYCDLVSSLIDPLTHIREYVVAHRFLITQNGVVSKHVGHGINNAALHRAHPDIVTYDPELFVAAVCKIEGIIVKETGEKIEPCTALFFGSGSVIVSGVWKQSHCLAALEYVTEMALPFKEETKQTNPKHRQKERTLRFYQCLDKPKE